MDEDKDQSTQRVTSFKVVRRRRFFRSNRYVVAVVLLLVACFAAGLGGGYLGYRLDNSLDSATRNATVDGNTVETSEDKDISSVASKVGPSVVSIISKGQTQSIFGAQSEEGAGSGIILSKDGYILTNKHVISDSTQLSVETSDGSVYSNAHVVGTDPLNDLAFIKVDGVDNLTPASLGDSSTVFIGQKVVAIGNSLGEYQNTVTSGIISGVGRPVSAQDGNSVENLTDLLQTDAAINPGNSGGPLVNLSGQVIGINTAVAQDAQSVGFSIPIDFAKGIITNLEKTGKVERAYLGINYVSITPQVAKKYKLSVNKGAYVVADSGPSVISGSPADKAGVKNGDVITKVGDKIVGNNNSVSSLVSVYTVGDSVQLTVIRGGKTITLTATLVPYVQPTNS